MARYTGPKNRICRIFGEPILGSGKSLGKNSNPPGQHGPTRKRKTASEYAVQLKEKQKAKYTNLRYGWVVLPTNEKVVYGFQFFCLVEFLSFSHPSSTAVTRNGRA